MTPSRCGRVPLWVSLPWSGLPASTVRRTAMRSYIPAWMRSTRRPCTRPPGTARRRPPFCRLSRGAAQPTPARAAFHHTDRRAGSNTLEPAQLLLFGCRKKARRPSLPLPAGAIRREALSPRATHAGQSHARSSIQIRCVHGSAGVPGAAGPGVCISGQASQIRAVSISRRLKRRPGQ